MAGRAPRSRLWSGKVGYYFATHDADGNVTSTMSVDDWKNLIRERLKNLVNSNLATWVVWIFHDMDATGKDPCHVHIIAHLVDAKEKSVVMGYFGCTREEDCEYVKNKAHAFRYLLHVTDAALNNANKAIYSYQNIETCVAGGVDFDLRRQFVESKSEKKKNKVDTEQMHRAVASGKWTVEQARAAYLQSADLGLTAWHSAQKAFDNDVRIWMNAVNAYYTDHNACKTTIYIQGGGGSRKTDLAQFVIGPHFADAHGVHVPASPMGRITYDPIGTYAGQRVSVLNEIKGASWILEGFCECMDATHAGMTGSRYFDRPYFPEYVVMTTSDYLETFIKDMFVKWFNAGKRKDNYKFICDRIYTPGVLEPELLPALESEKEDYYGHTKKVAFSDAPGSIWDKVWQVRRRIPIYIQLHDSLADIWVLDYSKRTCWIFDDGVPYGNRSPYTHYCQTPYSLTDDAVKTQFLQSLDNAIAWYYQSNGHAVTPWTHKRPDFNL